MNSEPETPEEENDLQEKNGLSETLKTLRHKHGFTQDQLENRKLSLSASLIAMLESGKRTSLTRDQAWYIVNAMRMTPAEADSLLEAAGLSTLRSEEEELDIQKYFEGLKEIWIFARVIRDKDSLWFDVVSTNIFTKKAKYCYFTSRLGNFKDFHARLRESKPDNIDDIDKYLECYLLPEELFISNFAIYNPGRPNMYCCGCVTEHGKGVAFYTSSECSRLFELLEDWKGTLDRGDSISIGAAEKVFPSPRQEALDNRTHTVDLDLPG